MWRPRFLADATRAPGRLGPPPAPSQDGAALQGLDVDGLKGGANAVRIGARLCSSARARKSGPEARDATVERRRARVPVTRHAGASAKVPLVTMRLNRRSAPSMGARKEMKARPAPQSHPGPMDRARMVGQLRPPLRARLRSIEMRRNRRNGGNACRGPLNSTCSMEP